jgi:transcriptional regulator with XRE-family HTH domain
MIRGQRGKGKLLADLIGVDQSYISYLRSGSRVPSVVVLLRIIDVVQMPCEEALSAMAAGPRAFGDFLDLSLDDWIPAEYLTQTLSVWSPYVHEDRGQA